VATAASAVPRSEASGQRPNSQNHTFGFVSILFAIER
jgi:hypothetical protein